MKIRLIDPSRYLATGKLAKARWIFSPALTLPLLAALTPADVQVSITNEVLDDIDWDEAVDLVGITSYTSNVFRAYEIADKFRRRGIPVVMGGIHISSETQEAAGHADAVVIGEAEATWPLLIDDFRHGRMKKIYRPPRCSSVLANLPLPRFSLLDPKRYLALQKTGINRWLYKTMLPIQSSRGCPFSCTFCSVNRFYGNQYRIRPVAEVVTEIKALGAKNCYFVDDNMLALPRHARELLTALIPLKVKWFGAATIDAAKDPDLIRLAKKSGCVELCIGLESLSPANLDALNKKTNRVEQYEKYLRVFRQEGISVAAGMMFGLPGDDRDVFKNAYEFLVRNRVQYTSWEVARPFPGTRLFDELKKQGRLVDDQWWLKISGKIYHPQIRGLKMDAEEFARNFYQYNRLFYSWRSIFKRILLPPQPRWFLVTMLNLSARTKMSRQTTILDN